jgi:hypothetical protein
MRRNHSERRKPCSSLLGYIHNRAAEGLWGGVGGGAGPAACVATTGPI